MSPAIRSIQIIVLAAIGLLAFFAVGVDGLQREKCLQRVSEKIKNNVTLNENWFWGSNGKDEQYPVLTLLGCHQLCTGDGRWYFDAGQRIITWLLPVVLLVGNIDVSPLDKWRYFEVAHLLGDPIDSMWSLLAIVDAWSLCLFLAERELGVFLGLTRQQLGTILAAIGEIVGPEQDPFLCLRDLVFPRDASQNEGDALQDEGDSAQPMSTRNLKQPIQQSYEMPKQPGQGNITTVNGSTDQDNTGEESEDANTPEERLISKTPRACSPKVIKILKDSAYEIADSRTDDIIRTIFAICLYILQVLAAFIAALGGGNSSPPGGRIGTAMLLTWLIPAILLSNSVGGFASRRSCFRVISKMTNNIRAEQKRQRLLLSLRRLQKQPQSQEQVQAGQEPLQRELQELVQFLQETGEETQNVPIPETTLEKKINDKETFFRDQRWRGGSDVYRPEKSHHFDTRSKKYSWIIPLLSIGPVFISFIFGSAIIGMTPPYGFNCRSVMLISITSAWILSTLITYATAKLERLSARCHRYLTSFTHAIEKLGGLNTRGHRYLTFFTRAIEKLGGLSTRDRWYFVFWKDLVVAVPSVLLVFFSSAGLFNTCDCWSFRISKKDDAHVPLNVTSEFENLDGKLYPTLVSLCLFLQFALFFGMYVVGRPGFKLMRWSERKRQMEFLENPPHSPRFRIWQFLKSVGRMISDLVTN